MNEDPKEPTPCSSCDATNATVKEYTCKNCNRDEIFCDECVNSTGCYLCTEYLCTKNCGYTCYHPSCGQVVCYECLEGYCPHCIYSNRCKKCHNEENFYKCPGCNQKMCYSCYYDEWHSSCK
jgi:hypothetical protein